MQFLNMSDFNWQLIPSFLAAHQHGSLLGAARALGISQPTVGRHVSALEAQLGTPLFERTGRGLVPTRPPPGWPTRRGPWRPARRR